MQNGSSGYPEKDVEDILVGRASRKRNWSRVFFTLAFIIVAIFAVMFIFFGDYKIHYGKTETQSEEITIDKLLKAYSDSPDGFKKTYQGKTMKITGRVYDVNVSGKYVVMTTLNGDNTDTKVLVTFKRQEDLKKMYKLMTGEKIEISGKVTSATNSTMQLSADLLVSVEG